MSDQLADNRKRASDLISIMDVIQLHPELFPDSFSIWDYEISAWFYGDTAKQAIADSSRELRKLFAVTKSDKNYKTGTFQIELQIPGTYYYIRLYTQRENVCRKVTTGEFLTREVPDYSQVPKKTISEEVVSWECDPILDAN